MGGFTAPAPPVLDLATSEGLPLIYAHSVSIMPMMALPPLLLCLVAVQEIESLAIVQLALARQVQPVLYSEYNLESLVSRLS